MKKTPIPSNVLYKDMTPQQQAIVKLWLTIGLEVEAKNGYKPRDGTKPNKNAKWIHWNSYVPVEEKIKHIDALYEWYIRLKR